MNENKKKKLTKTPPISASSLPLETGQRLDRIWKKAYSAQTNDDLVELYAEWADTYDEDHHTIGYFGHVTATSVLAKHLSHLKTAAILDAGAGTGIAGEELANQGFGNLTALDLSAEMLEKAKGKGVYRDLHVADLGQPLDMFKSDWFDAAILVGVFSYGQAPAHALEELVRIIKPGGFIVFTMRTDFYETDAMDVRSKIERFEHNGIWELVEITEPQKYLPNKDPEAEFRVWCYRLLSTKKPKPSVRFKKAVSKAFKSKSRVKAIDHSYIWNSMASRLYNEYIESPDYYLTDCEEEIIQANAEKILGGREIVAELGCGSARKVSHLFDTYASNENNNKLTYIPIDVSEEAIASTEEEIKNTFEDDVKIRPMCGRFQEKLSQIPADKPKTILFFGSTLGNLQTIDETTWFLKSLEDQMRPQDRLIVGIDLHKNPDIVLKAYNAGRANRLFFLNMLRRINYELGAEFDLEAFRLRSTYQKEITDQPVNPWVVALKVVSEKIQDTKIPEIDMHVHLEPGDAVQVGFSRKFRKDEIKTLGAFAGFQLTNQWTDSKSYFSLNEFAPKKSKK